MFAFSVSNAARGLKARAFAVCVLAIMIALSAFVSPGQASDIDKTLQKANVYIELAKSTERAVESWERYASWVNMKTGPTGKERYLTYGMYELYDIDGLTEDLKAAVADGPPSEALDSAMARYLLSYQALAPIMGEAARYHERQGYLADKMAKGKEYHVKMVPLAEAFLAERKQMLPILRAHLRDVEAQEAEAILSKEGKSASWQVANVMAKLNRVMDAFPRERPQQLHSDEIEQMMMEMGPDTPGEKFDQLIAGVKPPENATIDVKRYDAALADFKTAVGEFEQFNGEKPKDFDKFKPMPGEMLALLQGFQEPLAKSEGREFDGAGQMVMQIVQYYYNMMSESSSVWSSRLRHLP